MPIDYNRSAAPAGERTDHEPDNAARRDELIAREYAARDADDRYIRACAAGWAAGVMRYRRRPNEGLLRFACWLPGDDAEREQAVLDIVLTKAEQERLGPELKRAAGSPDELADVMWMAMGRSAVGRLKRVVSELSALFETWAAEREGLRDCSLARQVARARRTFGLSHDETETCFLLSSMKWHDGVREWFDSELGCDRISRRHVMAAALGMTPRRLGRVLRGKPGRIGMLEDRGDWVAMDSDFAPFFADPDAGRDLRELFRRPPEPSLPSDELGVSSGDLALLKGLLEAREPEPMHIILHGPAGTGKTTLARALVRELRLGGIEVMGERDSMGRSRRAALAACLEMAAAGRRSVVLVDEADRLLSTRSSWLDGGEVMDKGWLTRLLDESAVRTIWIVNDIDGIDPAVRRRFAHAVEMRPLGLRARRRMIADTLTAHGLGRAFDDAQVGDLARRYAVAPAILATAVAAVSRAGVDEGDAPQQLHRVLESKLNLMEQSPQPEYAAGFGFLEQGVRVRGVGGARGQGGLRGLTRLLRGYERQWARPGADAQPLAVLFHGAPGTGKSLTARHLAEQLDREVVAVRGSELLDMYVGGTEKRIAGAFAAAAARGAVLLLDEVDTFLQPRSQAQRSWETTMVNEMLVQLENHRGLVIATTNRIEGLDPAALRRFTVKAEFLPLDADRLEAVYGRVLQPLADGDLKAGPRARLRALRGVTTADMVLVRRGRLLGADLDAAMGSDAVARHEELIAEIAAEAASRGAHDVRGVIGFAAVEADDDVEDFVDLEPVLLSAERKESACR